MLFANLRKHIDLKAMARQWRRLPLLHILLGRCGFIIRFFANVPVTKSLYQSSRGRCVCRFRVKVLRPGSARFFACGEGRLTEWPFAPSLLSGPVFPVSGAAKADMPRILQAGLVFSGPVSAAVRHEQPGNAFFYESFPSCLSAPGLRHGEDAGPFHSLPSGFR